VRERQGRTADSARCESWLSVIRAWPILRSYALQRVGEPGPRLTQTAFDEPSVRHSLSFSSSVTNQRSKHMTSSAIVLVTGSAGRSGRAVVAELQARGRAVRGFDCVPTPGLDDYLVGDITDATTVRRAMEGIGALVHLAATPDDDDFLTRLLPNNIVGV